MKRLLGFAVLLTGILYLQPLPAADSKAIKETRDALQELNEYIGSWKGGSTGTKELWQEKLSWGWKFKKDEAPWLVLEVDGGKFLKGGEMRYLPDKKVYQLTATDPKGQKVVFEGKIEKNYLNLSRTDPANKEVQQYTMYTAADGIRFIYRYQIKPEGRTSFNKIYEIHAAKEGESLAGGSKKTECCVTGGLGTMAVNHKGVTYYVCCSGCRDAFNDNPEKIIAEYMAKKKAGK